MSKIKMREIKAWEEGAVFTLRCNYVLNVLKIALDDLSSIKIPIPSGVQVSHPYVQLKKELELTINDIAARMRRLDQIKLQWR